MSNIFFNYNFLYIIKKTLNYIYNGSLVSLGDRNLKSKHNEVMNLCLVNKYWFKAVQYVLKKLLTFSNKPFLSSFILKYPNNFINNNNNNNNNYYGKLIENISILPTNIEDINTHSKNYDMVRVKINLNKISDSQNQTAIKQLKSKLIEFLPNYEFHLIIGNNSTNIDFTNDHNNNISLHVMGHSQPLEDIIKLKPRKIFYQPNDHINHFSQIVHINCKSFFKLDSLEDLRISDKDWVNPYDISKINNETTKLKVVSVNLLFHTIIKGLWRVKENNEISTKFFSNACCSDYNSLGLGLEVKNSILEDWAKMVETLKNNSTIKELKLYNFKCIYNCIEKIDTSIVTLDLEEIFKSPVSKIETLTLKNFDFLDASILTGIAKSKSIKNLTIDLLEVVKCPEVCEKKASLIFEHLLLQETKNLKNIKILIKGVPIALSSDWLYNYNENLTLLNLGGKYPSSIFILQLLTKIGKIDRSDGQ
ncbi:hypothetical protein DICPUDRAFT_81710 [Dictyostelium purpureum]|uniref:Uncharacterized protein n=1 Tax=Dictyostelium purpureum TaxID=5786 RepID=F0ZUC5_DICPU|nr:uncharacterized protein DICPUDRAFT_81710 [Dictyostelium purpureum]EGC32453.1 hypothetical protein DICPUDRAFT_81710 [Dictyostelium purpureum]|eukprot:XP_003291025.1 hypothetical protein DICPUDRAFT_81710 [Dictyostelium purpureum]